MDEQKLQNISDSELLKLAKRTMALLSVDATDAANKLLDSIEDRQDKAEQED